MIGDYAPGVTIDKKFTTIASTGAPATLSGTPAISIYKDNSVTQSTSGVTLSVDFDSVTGLNNVRIDTSSDGTFYSAGSTFAIVITTGTVDSVSVVGYVVDEFTLKRSVLADGAIAAATIADNAIDAGAFAADAITAAKVAADVTSEIQSGLATAAELAKVPKSDGTTSWNATALAAIQQEATDALNAYDPPTKAELDTAQGAVTVATNGDKTGYQLSNGGLIAIWQQLTANLTSAGTIGKLLVDNVDATVSSRASQTSLDTVDDFLDTEIAAILAAVDTEVAAIKAKTDNLPEGISKNVALNNFEFFMVDSADHVTGKTGLTVTAERSIDGGAFAACANAVTEVANGIYKINLANTDLNGDFITLKFTATGADATVISLKTEVA